MPYWSKLLPIYFPFTYVSQQTAAGLAKYFRQITVYQASARQVPVDMQKLVDDGFLVSEDQDTLSEYQKGLHTKFFVLEEGQIEENEFNEFFKKAKAYSGDPNNKRMTAAKAARIFDQLKEE